jgi:plasmid stabilization system protein ParE
MVKLKYQLVWTMLSQQHIRAAWKYISKDSPKISRRVIDDIIIATEKAIDNPEFYPPDKYKKNNDGSYRAFEKHSYLIVYRYSNNIVRVLRVRHTKMEPKDY